MRHFYLGANACNLVKFDTDQLPPILNALETDNGGNRLVLEVAVRGLAAILEIDLKLMQL